MSYDTAIDRYSTDYDVFFEGRPSLAWFASAPPSLGRASGRCLPEFCLVFPSQSPFFTRPRYLLGSFFHLDLVICPARSFRKIVELSPTITFLAERD